MNLCSLLAKAKVKPYLFVNVNGHPVLSGVHSLVHKSSAVNLTSSVIPSLEARFTLSSVTCIKYQCEPSFVLESNIWNSTKNQIHLRLFREVVSYFSMLCM